MSPPGALWQRGTWRCLCLGFPRSRLWSKGGLSTSRLFGKGFQEAGVEEREWIWEGKVARKWDSYQTRQHGGHWGLIPLGNSGRQHRICEPEWSPLGCDASRSWGIYVPPSSVIGWGLVPKEVPSSPQPGEKPWAKMWVQTAAAHQGHEGVRLKGDIATSAPEMPWKFIKG